MDWQPWLAAGCVPARASLPVSLIHAAPLHFWRFGLRRYCMGCWAAPEGSGIEMPRSPVQVPPGGAGDVQSAAGRQEGRVGRRSDPTDWRSRPRSRSATLAQGAARRQPALNDPAPFSAAGCLGICSQ